jgi:hypothetical protein
VKSEIDRLYIEHMGAVVPFEIVPGTRFSGVGSAGAFTEGEEVSARFTVRADTHTWHVAEESAAAYLAARRDDGARDPGVHPNGG